MKKYTLYISIAALVFAGFSFFSSVKPKKIAFVRSSELVYGYLGMKEAHNKFDQKQVIWKTNLDTLKDQFQKDLNDFNSSREKLSPSEREDREKYLNSQQENLVAYSQSIALKAKEEDDKMTQSVLNQINSFVQKYGLENGYEIILGTTLSGNLLYANDAIDITDEVLKALNSDYKG